MTEGLRPLCCFKSGPANTALALIKVIAHILIVVGDVRNYNDDDA